MPGSLGRRPPTDWRHVERHPLTRRAAVALSPTPVAVGVNWYRAMDDPVRDAQGHWWMPSPKPGARTDSGHCFALKPRGVTDPTSWWTYYDQGREGACVGYGCSRVMSLMNRKRYNARWLWDRAKATDEWADTNPGDDNGTSVRAGLDILRLEGHVLAGKTTPILDEGIIENRWIRSVDDLLEVLGYQDKNYVDQLNSWGRAYPHLVRIPIDLIDRLWREDGEFGVVVDRVHPAP